MQHIVPVAFDFDDDRVRSIAETTVEKEMGKIVKDIVLDRLAPMEQTWYHGKLERNWEKFERRVNEMIEDILDEHKDEVIELAATKLVESYKRTKAWKEKAGEVL